MVLYPDQPEKQASPSTVYAGLYRETAKDPGLKEHFRQKQAKPHHRKGVKLYCALLSTQKTKIVKVDFSNHRLCNQRLCLMLPVLEG
jgi:hypothetical protein